MNILTFLVFTALLLALVLTTGCGTKENAKAATQVAARVNADEITVHQVNNMLARSQNVAPEAAAQAKREILDRLIDQHLARQQAIGKELDRSPNVMQAIEAAKSEILAQAYLKRIVALLPKPTRWETNIYYLEHPELFAKRRLFNLEEFEFVAIGDVAIELRKQLPKVRSMQEIATWLQPRVTFVVNRGVRAAEQIPLAILRKLHEMKVGEIQLFDAGSGRFQVIRVVGSKAAPMDEATATPRIQQFLFNRRATEVIAKEMQRLRNQAKIELVGEFAGDAAAAVTRGKAEPKALQKSDELSKEQLQK